MLMSEPLAAALLSGSVLAILWAADRRNRFAWLLPGALLGATAMVRPEYLAVAFVLALVVFTLHARSSGASPSLRRRFSSPGRRGRRPWTIRNAVALDRFVPISTGGGQVLFAGTYLPSGGNPERVGQEVVARHPGLFDPRDVKRLRLEQILAALAAQRYPGLESDAALQRMGRDQLWNDIASPSKYAASSPPRSERSGRTAPRVMRRPASRHCTGPSSPSACSA